MEYTIREMTVTEYPLLNEFLYEASFNVCRSHSCMQKCTHYFIRCYNGNADSTDS